jgi:hypothetical protein
MQDTTKLCKSFIKSEIKCEDVMEKQYYYTNILHAAWMKYCYNMDTYAIFFKDPNRGETTHEIKYAITIAPEGSTKWDYRLAPDTSTPMSGGYRLSTSPFPPRTEAYDTGIRESIIVPSTTDDGHKFVIYEDNLHLLTPRSGDTLGTVCGKEYFHICSIHDGSTEQTVKYAIEYALHLIRDEGWQIKLRAGCAFHWPFDRELEE